MPKNTIIFHTYSDNQSDFVRVRYPLFVASSHYLNGGMKAELHSHCINDPITFNDVQSVVLQRPVQPVQVQQAFYYASLREKYKFNLVFEWDDVLWNLVDPHSRGTQTDDYSTKVFRENTLKIANLPNFVVCSTRTLAHEWKDISKRPAIVLPNGVPGGILTEVHPEIHQDIKKPKVLWGGAAGHEDDFWPNWKEWLTTAINNDRIEFHTFVVPDFLKPLESKIFVHPQTTVLTWLPVINSIHPDIYIAPIVNNTLNRSKSDLKVKEAAAIGCVFLGSDFPGSPYSGVAGGMRVKETEAIQPLVDNICIAENYNAYRNSLRSKYDSNGWDICSQKFMRRWMEAYANGREI